MSSHQARDYGGARTVPSTLAPAHHPLMPVMDRPGAWLGGQTGSTGRPTSGSATASGTGTSGTVAVVIDEGGGESGTPEEGGDKALLYTYTYGIVGNQRQNHFGHNGGVRQYGRDTRR